MNVSGLSAGQYGAGRPLILVIDKGEMNNNMMGGINRMNNMNMMGGNMMSGMMDNMQFGNKSHATGMSNPSMSNPNMSKMMNFAGDYKNAMRMAGMASMNKMTAALSDKMANMGNMSNMNMASASLSPRMQFSGLNHNSCCNQNADGLNMMA